jgi:hypothetical protein
MDCLTSCGKFLYIKGINYLNNVAAFSLTFFRVAQGLMGSSFGQEDKWTGFYLLQSSEWWAANLCSSSCFFFVLLI